MGQEKNQQHLLLPPKLLKSTVTNGIKQKIKYPDDRNWELDSFRISLCLSFTHLWTCRCIYSRKIKAHCLLNFTIMVEMAKIREYYGRIGWFHLKFIVIHFWWTYFIWNAYHKCHLSDKDFLGTPTSGFTRAQCWWFYVRVLLSLMWRQGKLSNQCPFLWGPRQGRWHSGYRPRLQFHHVYFRLAVLGSTAQIRAS
jgi:hypothetical protein